MKEVTPQMLRDVLAPRPRDCHKGDFGYVTLLGGSIPYSGAAKLANLSACALRAGAGVVRLAVPESIAEATLPYLLESTLCPLPSFAGDGWRDPLDAALMGTRALGIGMGWEPLDIYPPVLSHILLTYAGSIVLDAGGIRALKAILPELKSTCARVIITPHLGEFSYLTGHPLDTVKQNGAALAAAFAREYGVVVLLKGATTYVTDGSDTFAVTRGCPGMATAGSGDVLTGVLTGLLGYNPPSAKTVAVGAHLTAVAGEIAEGRVGDICQIASDTLSALPEAVAVCRREAGIPSQTQGGHT